MSAEVSARPLRIGVLGAGEVVRALHLPVLRAMSDADVRWICDSDLRSARESAKIFRIGTACSSLEECREDVDVVLVAIPVGFRRPALEIILDRGQHAFCEKPFAASEDDHRWMLAKARAARLRLGVALVRRFYGSTSLARRVLASGLLGQIHTVIAGEGSRVQRTGRHGNWYQASALASGGGVLRESGCHLIDQLVTICDVRGFALDSCVMTKQDGLDFETAARGVLNLGSGDAPRFRFEVSRLRDVYNGIVVRGANGEVRINLDVLSGVEIAVSDDRPTVRLGAPGPADALSAFGAEWQAFLSACREGAGFADEDTGLMTTLLIDACYTAAGADGQNGISCKT